ncbi:toxic anion resistance protein [Peribacillus sp. B-H-3]|uniref:toxic anion resistance protein n=1 Tax=Peribacillus sp. B-H-3 TaxID=3400420 RepID=UPI003B0119A1
MIRDLKAGVIMEGYGQGLREAHDAAGLLSAENREEAKRLANQLDLKDHSAIMSFGGQAQQNLSYLSDKLLKHIQKRDIAFAGDVISKLAAKLTELDPNELLEDGSSFWQKIFGKRGAAPQELISKFQKASAEIDRLTVKAERCRTALLSDMFLLEKLSRINEESLRLLNSYIAAGEIKLTAMELDVNQRNWDTSRALLDEKLEDDTAQKLGQRLYDLKLSREIAVQSAPQISLILQANSALADKIEISIMTAVSLWKNQVAMAISQLRKPRTRKMWDQVTEAENELFVKNAEILKTVTANTVKEQQSGLMDVQTLSSACKKLLAIIKAD